MKSYLKLIYGLSILALGLVISLTFFNSKVFANPNYVLVGSCSNNNYGQSPCQSAIEVSESEFSIVQSGSSPISVTVNWTCDTGYEGFDVSAIRGSNSPSFNNAKYSTACAGKPTGTTGSYRDASLTPTCVALSKNSAAGECQVIVKIAADNSNSAPYVGGTVSVSLSVSGGASPSVAPAGNVDATAYKPDPGGGGTAQWNANAYHFGQYGGDGSAASAPSVQFRACTPDGRASESAWLGWAGASWADTTYTDGNTMSWTLTDTTSGNRIGGPMTGLGLGPSGNSYSTDDPDATYSQGQTETFSEGDVYNWQWANTATSSSNDDHIVMSPPFDLNMVSSAYNCWELFTNTYLDDGASNDVSSGGHTSIEDTVSNIGLFGAQYHWYVQGATSSSKNASPTNWSTSNVPSPESGNATTAVGQTNPDKVNPWTYSDLIGQVGSGGGTYCERIVADQGDGPGTATKYGSSVCVNVEPQGPPQPNPGPGTLTCRQFTHDITGPTNGDASGWGGPSAYYRFTVVSTEANSEYYTGPPSTRAIVATSNGAAVSGPSGYNRGSLPWGSFVSGPNVTSFPRIVGYQPGQNTGFDGNPSYYSVSTDPNTAENIDGYAGSRLPTPYAANWQLYVETWTWVAQNGNNHAHWAYQLTRDPSSNFYTGNSGPDLGYFSANHAGQSPCYNPSTTADCQLSIDDNSDTPDGYIAPGDSLTIHATGYNTGTQPLDGSYAGGNGTLYFYEGNANGDYDAGGTNGAPPNPPGTRWSDGTSIGVGDDASTDINFTVPTNATATTYTVELHLSSSTQAIGPPCTATYTVDNEIQGAVYSYNGDGNTQDLNGIAVTDGTGQTFYTGDDRWDGQHNNGWYYFLEPPGANYTISTAPNQVYTPHDTPDYIRPYAPASYGGCGPYTGGVPASSWPDWCANHSSYSNVSGGGWDFVYPVVTITGHAYTEDYAGNTSPVANGNAVINDNNYSDGTPEIVSTDGAGGYTLTEPYGQGLDIVDSAAAPTYSGAYSYLGPVVRPKDNTYACSPPGGFGGNESTASRGGLDWCINTSSYNIGANNNYTDDFVYYPPILCGTLQKSTSNPIEPNDPYSFTASFNYPAGYVGPDGGALGDGQTVTLSGDIPPSIVGESPGAVGPGTSSASGISAGATFSSSSGDAADEYDMNWSLNNADQTQYVNNCGPGNIKVVDVPYTQDQGSGGVSVGGDFSGGDCSNTGELASWNNDSGTWPGSTTTVNGDFGAASFMTALAAGQITGYGSDQSIFANPPDGSTFANTPSSGHETLDGYSPEIGGNYNSNANQGCLTDLTAFTSEDSTANPPQYIIPESYGTTSAHTDISSLEGLITSQKGHTFPAPARTDIKLTPDSSISASTDNYTIGNGSVDTLTQGDNMAIFVAGNVYINSNIVYCGDSGGKWMTGSCPTTGAGGPNVSWSSNNDVPSLVIKASGNIYIGSNVTELDGTYIACGDSDITSFSSSSDNCDGNRGSSPVGEIDTCSQNIGGSLSAVPTNQRYATCDNQLAVYGSFISDNVKLQRTYGTLKDARPTAGSSSAYYKNGSDTTSCTGYDSGNSYGNGTCMNPVSAPTSVTAYNDYRATYNFNNATGNYDLNFNYENFNNGRWPPPGNYTYTVNVYVNSVGGSAKVATESLSPSGGPAPTVHLVNLQAGDTITLEWTNNEWIDINGVPEPNPANAPDTSFDPNLQIDSLTLSNPSSPADTPSTQNYCHDAGTAAPTEGLGTVNGLPVANCSAEVFYDDNEAALGFPAVNDGTCEGICDYSYGSAPPIF